MQPTPRKRARISEQTWTVQDSPYSMPSTDASCIHDGLPSLSAAGHNDDFYPPSPPRPPIAMEPDPPVVDCGVTSLPWTFEETCVEQDHAEQVCESHAADGHAAPEGYASSCGEPQYQTTMMEDCNNEREMVKTRFADIIGHAAAKLRIEEILLPTALPQHLADSILTGVRSLPASILLHGPPGCGKTQLAQAIAGESQSFFMAISPSDILSKFVGESEASMRAVFDKAYERANEVESKCTVLFFDEIDALGQSRGSVGGGGASHAEQGGDGCSRRVLAELLIQMNRISASVGGGGGNQRLSHQSGTAKSFSRPDKLPSHPSYPASAAAYSLDHCAGSPPFNLETTNSEPRPRVIVVSATNRPEDCDQALLRRFGIRVYVGLPVKRDRKRIINRLLRDVEHTITVEQLDDLSSATDGWSGSDLEYLTREAAMAPIRDCIQAASLVKRRAMKLQQRSGDESSQERGTKEVDPNHLAREKLLADFQALRPINLEDFENAVQFWLGKEGGTSQRVGNLTQRRRREHYDSSSDDEY